MRQHQATHVVQKIKTTVAFVDQNRVRSVTNIILGKDNKHIVDQEIELAQSEILALGLPCLARYHSNINSAKLVQTFKRLPPVVDEALEDLFSSDSTKVSCSYAFCH